MIYSVNLLDIYHVILIIIKLLLQKKILFTIFHYLLIPDYQMIKHWKKLNEANEIVEGI